MWLMKKNTKGQLQKLWGKISEKSVGPAVCPLERDLPVWHSIEIDALRDLWENISLSVRSKIKQEERQTWIIGKALKH